MTIPKTHRASVSSCRASTATIIRRKEQNNKQCPLCALASAFRPKTSAAAQGAVLRRESVKMWKNNKYVLLTTESMKHTHRGGRPHAEFILTQTLQKYVGRIDLKDDKDFLISRLLQGNRQPIYYSVHFPLQNPLPILLEVSVNDETLCQQVPEAITGGYTTITLTHMLTSPTRITFAPSVTDSDLPESAIRVQAEEQPQEPQRPPVSSNKFFVTKQPAHTTKKETAPQSFLKDDCGIPVATNQLVVNGNSLRRGSWPWLAAIFVTTGTGQRFQCGATLISKQHVITAAHCVHNVESQKQKLIEPRSIVIYLGKHYLLDFTESSVQAKGVSLVKVHPKYRHGVSSDNDLAVLVLSSPAEYSFTVQPACLFNSRLEYEDDGKVIGWGRDENGNQVSSEPKLVSLPIVSQEECLRSHRNFYYITSNTTFCAGKRDGSGPCNGDSGGGFYSQAIRSPGQWFLRGMVSLSLQDSTTASCDPKNYFVFTDLSKFADWVSRETGVAVNR
ncbi:Hypothetical predicted protein [Cloeon dipterum]|uniref:Peptidase S1 domain-containing protein n=1 Tax=Cloeon dipterum TaxID=197152 RepID=A0A8S1CD88_9INSE|nr:Hypothetical predicted protein [Cloeon dipterum]